MATFFKGRRGILMAFRPTEKLLFITSTPLRIIGKGLDGF